MKLIKFDIWKIGQIDEKAKTVERGGPSGQCVWINPDQVIAVAPGGRSVVEVDWTLGVWDGKRYKYEENVSSYIYCLGQDGNEGMLWHVVGSAERTACVLQD